MNLGHAPSKRPLTQEESDLVVKAQKAFEPIQSDVDREAKAKRPKTLSAAWDNDKQEWVIKKSGYQDREDLQKVRQTGHAIGHTFKPAGAMDKIDGEQKPGTFFTSHAEEKVAVNVPDAPIAEGPIEMCNNCVDFLQKLAQYQHRIQVVAGPKITRIFYADGKIGVTENGNVYIFDHAKDAYSNAIDP